MSRAEAVLFDLDGTLVDSAPDLAGAANDQRAAHGLPPMAFTQLRALVGSGARGMVGAAFGLKPGDDGYAALRDEFLQRYCQRLLRQTTVFDLMHEVLASLGRAGIPWGIVTNKALYMAQPIVDGLGLSPNCRVLISGDSTAFTKPHPEPLYEAARRLGVAPERCVYLGDDARDVLAGRAASMATLVAAWGYLGNESPIQSWGADAVLESPPALLKWLELA